MESEFKLARDNNPISLTPTFILPEDQRPKLSQVSTLSSIPIIDLSVDQDQHECKNSTVVQKISQACEEYGFFQITNHGVPRDLCERTMKVVHDFFKLPSQQRSNLFTTDLSKQVKVINYHLRNYNNDQEDQQKDITTMWSESFSHPWDPNGNFIDSLPENPPQYREVFVEYAREIDKLVKRLLALISLTLGVEKDALEMKLGQNPRRRAQANFYPPCPNPDLTLGLAAHTDLSAITVLMQSEEATGLQVIKDGKWVCVNPIPNAFVVNLGDQLQVLSNGRYKSVHHRAVTNKMKLTISLAMFYGPNEDVWIAPIEKLIDEEHNQVYRKYRFSEFLEEFARQAGTRRMVTEVFQIQNNN